MKTTGQERAWKLAADVGAWIRNPAFAPEPGEYWTDETLCHLADSNRLGPWLGLLLGRASGVSGSSAVMAYQHNLLAALAKLAATSRVQTLFAAEGIPLLAMRGVFAAHRHYGDVGLRLCEDVDLLVPPAARDRAREVLLEAGYALHDEGLPAAYFRRHAQHWSVSDPGNGVRLEIHWRLDHPFMLLNLDHEGIMARSQLAACEGFAWREADVCDDLLMACLHLHKHCRSARMHSLIRPHDVPWVVEQGLLYQWLDVALAVDRSPSPWPVAELLRRAERQRLLPELQTTLQSVAHIWQGPKTLALLDACGWAPTPAAKQAVAMRARAPLRTVQASAINYGRFCFPPRRYFASTGLRLAVARIAHSIAAVMQITLAVMDVAWAHAWRLCRPASSPPMVATAMRGCAS